MPAIMRFHLDFSDPELDFVGNLASTDPSWIRVTVEGARAITEVSGLSHIPSRSIPIFFSPKLYLPTDPLHVLEDTFWGNWISTIQGPIMGRCDVTPNQRQLLLDLVLTYRAFTAGTARVPDIWYTNFVRSLINIARQHSDRAIDAPLMTLTNGLRALLPNVSAFMPNSSRAYLILCCTY